ncbi:uL15 family ribosomal protein, partial [Escherichia coli]|nr:uL15 family ribosomal protein [Escherichia coli]
NMFRYHPGHYGKRGIRVFRLHKNRIHCESINLDRLWSLVSDEARSKFTADATKAAVIDVTKAGFQKVLGRGRLPNVPLVVRAKFFSKT